ncbi:DUF2487 family protein [Brevibacillus daliensis]|uniref:DUF2487 family protein n=1 Tax=Brevibacillus daliensis TaxID=2892995 RepID=UPI001E40F51A|nr:DUF2487 family protein [Brevibacillus daliensis]
MQWNAEELQGFEAVRPYYDTALLPHYIYNKRKSLAENAVRMNYISGLALAVEEKLKGRVLLFPLQYQIEEEGNDERQITLPGHFAYNVILRFSGQVFSISNSQSDGAVEILTVGDEDLESLVRFEITVEVFYKEILSIWQKGIQIVK